MAAVVAAEQGRVMGEKDNAEDLGTMKPAEVVRCAEGSNAVCWIRAKAVAEDGATTAYECCGGAGQKARFSIRRGLMTPRDVNPDEIPDGLRWSRRVI